jgi:hypothetical protein
MALQPLVIDGVTIAGVLIAACIWDKDPPAERTHSGAPQSQVYIGVTLELAVCERSVWGTLNTALDAKNGVINSIKLIDRNYGDPDTYVTFTAGPLGMWPQRPDGYLRHHLIMGSGKDGGPTLRIDHVVPARV